MHDNNFDYENEFFVRDKVFQELKYTDRNHPWIRFLINAQNEQIYIDTKMRYHITEHNEVEECTDPRNCIYEIHYSHCTVGIAQLFIGVGFAERVRRRKADYLHQIQINDRDSNPFIHSYMDENKNIQEFEVKRYHITDRGIIEECKLFNFDYRNYDCIYFKRKSINYNFFRNTTLYDRTHFNTYQEAVDALVGDIENHTNKNWQKAGEFLKVKGLDAYIETICKHEQEIEDDEVREEKYKEEEKLFNRLVRLRERREKAQWKEFYED